eukprot:6212349-Pleurochrysis_carterae.AAC.2
MQFGAGYGKTPRGATYDSAADRRADAQVGRSLSASDARTLASLCASCLDRLQALAGRSAFPTLSLGGALSA